MSQSSAKMRDRRIGSPDGRTAVSGFAFGAVRSRQADAVGGWGGPFVARGMRAARQVLIVRPCIELNEDVMATIVGIHLTAAVVAVMLGVGILLMRRGTPRHRWMGRLWVAAMAVTATTSFGIRELGAGHLSWLHALSAYVLVSLVLAVLAIRRRNVIAHRRQMLGLYAGLVIAGVAAVAVPGRTLSNALAQMWHHEATQAVSGTTQDANRGARDRHDARAVSEGNYGSDRSHRSEIGDKQAGALKQTSGETQTGLKSGPGLLAMTSAVGPQDARK
ncbi:DUF2306 domain-containing protein [Pandoraea sp. NPDC087047]|uniref:DUF2306 domain-containing protein n=1 Tax=Pandoraea sp. NPDC087047 TaxID=3364390 RepID=UPI00382AF647